MGWGQESVWVGDNTQIFSLAPLQWLLGKHFKGGGDSLGLEGDLVHYSE